MPTPSLFQEMFSSLDLEKILSGLKQVLESRLTTLAGHGVWLREANLYRRYQYRSKLAHRGYPVQEIAAADVPAMTAPFLAAGRFPFLNQDDWIRDCIVAPLWVQDQLIGWLDLYSDTRFSQDDLDALGEVLPYVSGAIDHARKYMQESEELRFYALLHEINMALNSSLELDVVIDQVLNSVQVMVPYRTADVRIIDGELLHVIGARGFDEQFTSAPFDIPIRWRDFPLMREIHETGQAVVVRDTQHDPRWKAEPPFHWIRSHLKVPMRSNGKVIGFLNLDSHLPGFFTQKHALWMQTFADQAALALHNAQVYRIEREQRRFNEAMQEIARSLNSVLNVEQIIQQILLGIEHVIQPETALIMLVEEGGARIVGHLGFEKYGPTEWLEAGHVEISKFPNFRLALETGQPNIIADTHADQDWVWVRGYEWVRCHVDMPIQIEGRVIGFLNLDSRQPGSLNERHGMWLQAFADQAAVAIRNAQLYMAEHEQRVLNEALNETAALLSRTLMLDEVFNNILEIVDKVVPHEASNIMLLERGVTRTISVRGYDRYGVTEFVKNLRFNIGETGDFQKVISTRQVSVISDTHGDPDWKGFPELVWVRSHIKAPIIIDGQVIGFIHLDGKEPHFFTQKHAEVIRAFAEQAALAIRNAQYYTAEHEQRVLNEALNETAALLNRSLLLDEVFDNILKIVGKVIPHETSSMMLADGDFTRMVSFRGHEKYVNPDSVKVVRFKISESPHFRQVVETRQVIVIPDVKADPRWLNLPDYQWIRSHLKAPIIVDDQVIGFLNLDSTEPNFFTAQHVAVMQLFADQVAVALKNAQLYTAEHEQRQMNEALSATARILSSTLELNQVIDAILGTVGQVVPHETSSIMLIEQGRTRTLGHRGFEKYGLQDWIKNLSFDTRQAIKFQQERYRTQTNIVEDTLLDPEWVNLPETQWIRSQMTAPIRIEDELIGFLHLDSSQPYFFQSKHLPWLAAFAEQAAIAIRNARLFTAEREQRRINEALSKTARILNSTLELDQVIEAILETVGQVVPHEASNVMVVENKISRTIGSRGYEKYKLRDWINNVRLDLEKFPILYARLLSGKARIFSDTHASPDWIQFPETIWVRSNILMPIQFEGELLGMVNLDSSEPGFFRTEQAESVQAFAEQAATAIKNAQLYAVLNQERARLEAILNATGEGILYTEDGRIKYANQSFLQMTGIAAEKLLNREFVDFIDLSREEQHELREQVDQALRQHGQFRRRTLLLNSVVGDPIDIEVAVTLVSEENPRCTVIVARDINQEKQLQMRQNRFITHAAHELRHPLANFMTRLYLLRRKPNEWEEHLNRLDETAQRMTSIIEDMLMVSRFGQGQVTMNPTPTPMQEVIEQVIGDQRELIEALHVQVSRTCPEEPIVAMLDRKLFVEMMSTLLVNAMTYGGENSRVEVCLSHDAQNAVLEITDSGRPLPEEQLAQFFEPFHRPSAGNIVRTGLELTIAEHIVTQHKGSISIRRGDSGNTIRVKLPLQP
jgi:PAS domain S-box-containing protein